MQRLLYLLYILPILGQSWELGPFERVESANPILKPCETTLFLCPIQEKMIPWESIHVFNPAAVVRNGKVYLIYRAEDNYGEGIGYHTSRLGLAESEDGIHFHRKETPVVFPNADGQKIYEFPGGCEDPRIVETEEGGYIMTYTQWNRDVAVLAIASSNDLVHWEKHGYAFEDSSKRFWCKSGSIVCRREGDHLIATKIQGKYWMYWGEGCIYAATSSDLIRWTPIKDEQGNFIAALSPRKGEFDSFLVESGPPALLTEKGVLLLYNGKNSLEEGDPAITPNAYSAGQVLFDKEDPLQIIARCKHHFLTPERPYERYGQYHGGTVFIEGLVPFQGKWLLYYGTADSAIAIAICHETNTLGESHE